MMIGLPLVLAWRLGLCLLSALWEATANVHPQQIVGWGTYAILQVYSYKTVPLYNMPNQYAGEQILECSFLQTWSIIQW